jgi:Na+/citrate or Na+/malate symporter
MRTATKLTLVKTVHTLIWLFFVCVIGSIVTAGITGRITGLTWVAMMLIVLEGIVLSFNRGTCPLTPLAARYTSERGDNFDIYLPRWLARHNKRIFTPVAVAGIFLVVYRALR